MWGNAFNDDDPLNPALADEYGIVMGTSHHEPMMRAHEEWRRYGQGPMELRDQPRCAPDVLDRGIRRTAAYENIVTLGMRGDGDEPMSEEANIALLERIVADQRRIIAENRNRDVAAVPQVWALYKEVQEYYDKGMRVPDDVTLLWCDDNWGNIRRLPTPEERAPARRSGHLLPLRLRRRPAQLQVAEHDSDPEDLGADAPGLALRRDRIWIVNVGDIKPMEFPIQFFLDYAWNPARWPADEPRRVHPRLGGARVRARARAGDRRPRLDLHEIQRAPQTGDARAGDLQPGELPRGGDRRRRLPAPRAAGPKRSIGAVPAAAKDAFYQLVLHPIKASAMLNELYVTAARTGCTPRRAGRHERSRRRARELFEQDASISREYNKTLAGGKWNHMMDQTHIGYTYWHQPLRNAMPAVQQIQVPAAGEMGVAIEGSDASWPGGDGAAPVLPALTTYDRTPRYIDIFNRGREPFIFSVETSDPWLEVDTPRVSVEREQRVWVRARWSEVPLGADHATVTITGPGDVRVVVRVPVLNPATPRPEALEGFVETNGYVSIEAAHYSRAVAPEQRQWLTIPDHGRTLSGVTPWPVTPTPSAGAAGDMRLEYRMFLFTAGTVRVSAYLAPTQKFRPGPGFRYGISFDDEDVQSIDVHADTSLKAWERSVADGVTVLTSTHAIARSGYHVLKLRALDPGLVLQKLVVDTGGLRSSYLGPPESFHREAARPAGAPPADFRRR